VSPFEVLRDGALPLGIAGAVIAAIRFIAAAKVKVNVKIFGAVVAKLLRAGDLVRARKIASAVGGAPAGNLLRAFLDARAAAPTDDTAAEAATLRAYVVELARLRAFAPLATLSAALGAAAIAAGASAQHEPPMIAGGIALLITLGGTMNALRQVKELRSLIPALLAAKPDAR
jgi:hypothetical protein